jgi:hypothetical protein
VPRCVMMTIVPGTRKANTYDDDVYSLSDERGGAGQRWKCRTYLCSRPLFFCRTA